MTFDSKFKKFANENGIVAALPIDAIHVKTMQYLDHLNLYRVGLYDRHNNGFVHSEFFTEDSFENAFYYFEKMEDTDKVKDILKPPTVESVKEKFNRLGRELANDPNYSIKTK